MKKALIILSSVITFSLASFDLSAQTAEKQIRVVVDNGNSNRAFKDKEKKKLDFTIQGLADQATATAFASKVKTFEGVKSFELSKDVVNGGRAAHIEFNETYTESYFQKLLLFSNVDLLIVNGKRKPIKNAAGSK